MKAAILAVGLLASAVLVQWGLRPGESIEEVWSVAQDGPRVTVEGVTGERVVVWPVVLPAPVADPTPLMRALAERVWPGAQWEAPVGPRMRGRRGAIAGIASIECSGTDATFTFLSAPADRLADVEETLRAVAANCPPVESEAYVAWTDPNEGALTVEVPAGWSVRGGWMRSAPHVSQMYVEARSPGGARVWAGDYVPLYALPDPSGPLGSQELDGGGYPWTVAPYAPGAEAAVRLLPDGAVVVRAERVPSLGDAGWVEYALGDRRGVALCVTERHDTWWRVERMYVAEATAEEFAGVLTALTRLAESMHGSDGATMFVRSAANSAGEILTDPVTGLAFLIL